MAFSKEDTQFKVIEIIAGKLNMPKENIDIDSTFQELGADSLDIVEMIMGFEESFGIEIKDEDAEKIKIVKDVIDHIHQARTK
ncbi:acyl carrier protein [Candidatus Babeliales bacterium]|nr:acyl carrier protein [Candidatus Babeliales bacterium]MCF7899260.1 acyl carrier protein [Candidatus Babeliales bacterium]